MSDHIFNDQQLRAATKARVAEQGVDLSDRAETRRAVARALAAQGVVVAPQVWARLTRDIVNELSGAELAREVFRVASSSPVVFGLVAEALADAAETLEASGLNG